MQGFLLHFFKKECEIEFVEKEKIERRKSELLQSQRNKGGSQVSNIDSEEEQESPDAKKQSPKKKAKPQVNGKKDPNEEDSAEEGQTPRKQLDNYCIFNHSSEENIYHVK